AGDPSVLLVDEPVAGLDPFHQLQVMELLRDLAREGRAVLVVLHDLTLAMRYCDRLILLHRGLVAAEGEPDAVLGAAAAEEVFQVAFRRGDGWVLPWSRRGDG
ncbi:ABC transporter, partial [bacterium]|nr:ABC transporter [bacterium]